MIDPHFTNTELAQRLVEDVVRKYDPHRLRRYIEPSCGEGAFVDALQACGVHRKKIRTVDLVRKFGPDIRGDFLKLAKADLCIPTWTREETIVIGNPPFGRAGTLAKSFINKSIEFADLVCMIVPRSMEGAYNCTMLNERLQLTYEVQLPAKSFTTTDANCNWQEWFMLREGEHGLRLTRDKVDTRGLYTLVGPDDKYDLVIQRCGGSIGRVTTCNGTGQGKYYVRSRYPEVRRAFKSLREHLHKVPELARATHQSTLSCAALHRLLEYALLDVVISNWRG